MIILLAAVESFLAQGSDGQLGVTGEGTLLDNAEGTNFKASKQTAASPVASGQEAKEPKGITIAAAKYSSEDAATLVQYTIALVEYSQRCGPLRKAADRMHELEREIEETERIRNEEAADGEAEKVRARCRTFPSLLQCGISFFSEERGGAGGSARGD